MGTSETGSAGLPASALHAVSDEQPGGMEERRADSGRVGEPSGADTAGPGGHGGLWPGQLLMATSWEAPFPRGSEPHAELLLDPPPTDPVRDGKYSLLFKMLPAGAVCHMAADN